MHEIIALLNKSPIARQIQIIDLIQEKEVQTLKAKATLVDDSILYINRYVDENSNKYSYQWQTKNGSLITRWDNSPHHKNISTFPHHLHLQNIPSIKESHEISIEELLAYIANKIQPQLKNN